MASGRLSKAKGKVVDIPNPPTIGTATAGSLSASVTFTAYSGGVGGPTRSYIAKSNPGNITATGSTSPITVTGLTGDTSYTISVAGVNETGTSEYSSASNSVTATNPGSYESIATVTVGSGGQANVEFTSIPSTFTHLQVRCLAQTNRGTYGTDSVWLQLNSNTGSNYSRHWIVGDGSTLGTGNGNNVDKIYFADMGTSTGGSFGGAVVDILDYTSTNKNKTLRILGGTDLNGTVGGYGGVLTFTSGLFFATPAAITSIKMYPNVGTQFNQYSSFALYGIKGA